MIGTAIAIFQQLLGINVILYYAPRIFEELGTGQMASMFQTVIVGVINVIFMALAILFVDSLGRKPLLIGGSIGCAISLFTVAILSSLNIFGISTLIFILLFAACFQFSGSSYMGVCFRDFSKQDTRPSNINFGGFTLDG